MIKFNKYNRLRKSEHEIVPQMCHKETKDEIIKSRVPEWVRKELIDRKINVSSYILSLILADFDIKRIRKPQDKIIYMSEDEIGDIKAKYWNGKEYVRRENA